ncbi:DUF4180 domain-containing protein [Couchioplanes caeruleus]|uniref:Alpha/beta hydrolase n=2 Tax=Couchioplanes caeruleus TaxID=56438 RepID=A0A1K0GE89_9ACTN|nr:DUF4180 domain-containing protein [Couchioplanes caeruleus]OJF15546.1 alpha/beta hydrolase [Couchioplanes caeruleus subsp. caeruleus]ROP30316.1 uncharacterized protein DUF4180 [Couchioplanes caeruleus]
MTDQVIERGGEAVLLCAESGTPIGGPQDALDLIGAAFGQARMVAIPATRLDAEFFRLRTGVAGEIMQKFVNYRIRLAIVGDISAHVAASDALRDLVRESNKGDHVWFLPTLDDLDARLHR